MPVNLSPVGGAAAQFFDNNGIPLAGGLLYTYAAGTTTPLVTYTTQQATIANSNPIVLDSAGRVPNEIWLTSTYAYKFVLTNSIGAQVWSYDNLVGINSNFTAYALQEQTFTATQGQTVFTLTGISYVPGTNNLSVFVNGSKQIVSTNYLETSSTVVTFLTGLNVGDVVDFITAISTSTTATSSNNISYTQGSAGSVTTNVQAKLQQTVSVKDFGAVGDGVTDDTTAIQNCFNYAGPAGYTAYFPAGLYKTTSALTFTGNGGIWMEGAGYGGGSSGDYAIYPVGSGYTALTLNGTINCLNIALGGNGQTLNGVYWNNSQVSTANKIRVFNFNGFGLRLDKCWDSVFNTISVQLCGNTSNTTLNTYSYPNYAFGMFDAGDTCNMSHIVHIQVEQANSQAIYISPNSLCLVIDNIHSEQATPNVSYTTWSLGGNRCVYNSTRLNSNSPSANATVLLDAANTVFNGLLAEGSIVVTSSVYSGSINLIAPIILGTLKALTNTPGLLQLQGGTVNLFNTQATLIRAYDTQINTLTVNYANAVPTNMILNNCLISTLVSGDNTSAATFNNCIISECNSFLGGQTILNNSTATSASTITIGYRTVSLNNSIVNGNISMNFGTLICKGSTINGNYAQSYGQPQSLFDAFSYVTGSVSGYSYPATGTWVKGQRTYNIAPSSGSPKSWVCTASGLPGTWVSEGNL